MMMTKLCSTLERRSSVHENRKDVRDINSEYTHADQSTALLALSRFTSAQTVDLDRDRHTLAIRSFGIGLGGICLWY